MECQAHALSASSAGATSALCCSAPAPGPLPKRRVFLVGCGRVWRAPFPGGRAPALLSAGGALAEPPLPQLGAGPAPSGARRHRPGLVGS